MPRVRLPPTITLLALALALCAALVPRAFAFTCYSKALVMQKLRETRTLALNHDIKPQTAACIYEKGLHFKPDYIEPRDGLVIECYKDDELVKYMVAAMESCVGRANLMHHSSRHAVLRRPVQPDSPLRTVAHWLGLHETVRKSCDCWSGCHYCCIQTAIGGQDFCFQLYCGAVGMCD